jgi:transposase
VVANAQRVKKVPGRKTDVKDAEWIADLLCHGLLRASFVPPKPIRELRDLTRCRRKLVETRSAERNRLLKVLETANIKLASVVSDVFGASGLLMLQALAEGTDTAQEMAQLAKKQLRKKIPELQ